MDVVDYILAVSMACCQGDNRWTKESWSEDQEQKRKVKEDPSPQSGPTISIKCGQTGWQLLRTEETVD